MQPIEQGASEHLSFESTFFADPRRMDQADYLAPSHSAGGIFVGHYRQAAPTLDVSTPNDSTEGYWVPIILAEIPACNAWRDGAHRRSTAKPAGSICAYDLRHRWETELNFAFNTVNFYIPQSAFDDLTTELRSPRVERLNCENSETYLDPVAYHLAYSLAHIIDAGALLPSLLADQILIAARLHIATRYGGLSVPDDPPRRLSPKQVQSLKELLLDEPWRNIRLPDLAAACGMTTRVFERAFREQFGKPPHKWRTAARVASARSMLQHSNATLAEFAYACGFSDQSHFTRVFSRHVGVTPTAYRRTLRS